MRHISFCLAATALAGVSAAPAARAANTPAALDEVVVTAQRLDAARLTIDPSLGASSYALPAKFIDTLPGGANAGLNSVVLRAPGVAQDSFGQLHVRGDHGNLQYRLNGAILPEGLNLFGQTLSPRLAENVELITGALPAQYGLRTAGVVSITTRSGLRTGGRIGVYGGSHGDYQPSAEFTGSSRATSAFISADYKRSQLGIESPTGDRDTLHDRSDQAHAFAYIDHILDDSSRVSLILGASDQRFQIPNSPGRQPGLGLSVLGRSAYASEALDETQRESTEYAIVTYLRTSGKLTTQLSLFGRHSTLTFRPDWTGDLLYNGVAQNAAKSDRAAGVQAEGAYALSPAHTLRGGLIAQAARGSSRTLSRVLPIDARGAQTSDIPLILADSGARATRTYSLFAQDEWKLGDALTLNYGLRYDAVQARRREGALSPRINLVWTPLQGATVHAGYARYFTPAPSALVADQTVALFQRTTAASPGVLNTPPSAETADYLDAGVERRFEGGLALGLDVYHKTVRNLLDEGQFGAPIVLTPFNYRAGRVSGVEFTAALDRGPLSSYLNLAYSKAQGRGIASSQFNFDPADLAYIAIHDIPLDHDQTYTASAGASYLWAATRLGADLIYGSGLRADGATPNGRKLAAYTQVNVALSHTFKDAPLAGGLQVRLDVINLFDKVYEIRDGSGIGVGAPQFGPRRGYFVGLTKTF